MREPQTDPVELRRALRIIFTLHRVVEIRAVRVRRGYGRPVNMSGFFDDAEAAAIAVLALP